MIADIGGGIGAQLSNILDAHPSSRGILFDQPQAVGEAPQHSRMERVGGDFFAKIPIQADAYLLDVHPLAHVELGRFRNHGLH